MNPAPSRARHATRSLALAATTALLLTGCSTTDDGATVTELNDGDASASASGASSGSASAPASGSASGSTSGPSTTTDGVTAPDGAYAYASDVSAHRLVVDDVCLIAEALDADPIDDDAAATIYRDGVSSVNADGSVRSIGGFAAADDRNHGLDGYYDTATPLDDWVTAALDGTGRFEGEADAVRAQAIEKGVQNQIMVAWVVHELESALAKAADGDIDPAGGAPHNWDEAWAFYHGATPGCAPYATADKRAENFGTMDGSRSQANVNIASAMNSGLRALLDGDTDGARAAADEVVRNLVVTYSQAAVRYATLAVDDVAAGDDEKAREHQAEGLAFWRVIEAYVAEAGADVDAVNAVLDLSVAPGSAGGGDDVRAALRPAWDALGIDEATEIGELS